MVPRVACLGSRWQSHRLHRTNEGDESRVDASPVSGRIVHVQDAPRRLHNEVAHADSVCHLIFINVTHGLTRHAEETNMGSWGMGA